MKKRLAVFSALFFLAGVPNLKAACFQPTILDGILRANVDKDGYVNYDQIRVNKGGDLYEYLALIETVDLKKCSEPEQVAFWINAYNAHAIRLILARPQMNKVSDDFKLFGEPFKVAKDKYTLNDIEHRILRSSAKNGGPIDGVSIKQFDPRIHFALVWGAVDNVRLNHRAYTGANLEEALQDDAVEFANNPKYVRVENGKLTMNSVVHWYMDDFKPVGGVPVYLNTLIDPKSRPDADIIKSALTASATNYPQDVMFKYDWTVNSVKNKAAAPASTPK